MKIEDLVDLDVRNVVAVFGLVGHVDDVLPLQRDLIAVRVKDFLDVLTPGDANQDQEGQRAQVPTSLSHRHLKSL